MNPGVKVGDLVKVHGYIGEIKEVRDNGFWYETENDGERIFYQFDWTTVRNSLPRLCSVYGLYSGYRSFFGSTSTQEPPAALLPPDSTSGNSYSVPLFHSSQA